MWEPFSWSSSVCVLSRRASLNYRTTFDWFVSRGVVSLGGRTTLSWPGNFNLFFKFVLSWPARVVVVPFLRPQSFVFCEKLVCSVACRGIDTSSPDARSHVSCAAKYMKGVPWVKSPAHALVFFGDCWVRCGVWRCVLLSGSSVTITGVSYVEPRFGGRGRGSGRPGIAGPCYNRARLRLIEKTLWTMVNEECG